jgi:hypothetical protein
MTHTYNGMPSSELPDVTWRKSAHSNPNGACVEVAMRPEGEIAFRNSRFPSGPALVYTRAEIAAFLAGAKDGEFDHVLNLCTVFRRPDAPRSRPPETRRAQTCIQSSCETLPREKFAWETSACPDSRPGMSPYGRGS